MTYVASVGAAILTIEMLKPGGSAILFLEWTALVLILSALSDLGIPNAVQWALLTQRTSAPKSNAVQGQGGYGPWLAWAFRGFKNLAVLSTLLLTAIAVASLLILTRHDQGTQYAMWPVCLAIISVNARKLACAFLDGAGLFATSRLILATPNFLMALFIGLDAFHTKFISSFNDVAVIAAVSHFSASMVGFLLLCSPDVRRRIPAVSVSHTSHTSSLRWYLLSISSAAQTQLFYLLAPRFGAQDLMVPVFYAQKAVQVSTEFVAQFVKEWAHTAKIQNNDWQRRSRSITVKAGLIPAVAGVLALLASMPATSLAALSLGLLVAAEAALSAVFTCRGHIALMCGKLVPATAHMLGSATQSLLTVVLVPVLGAAGLYASILIAGALFSYRANQNIYRRSLHDRPSIQN
jgi:hypothetical protein